MLKEQRKSLKQLPLSELIELADYLCHDSPIVHPVFECIKVFARLHESGKLTYARYPFDLGTDVITSDQISSRMNDVNRKEIVHCALQEVEEHCIDIWPFSPGSSSWILLEILHPDVCIAGNENYPAIIFRKAVRINSKGEHFSSQLLERMFEKLKKDLESSPQTIHFEALYNPTIQLNNISGSGIYAKFTEQVEGITYLTEGKDMTDYGGLQSYWGDVVNAFATELLESNFQIAPKNNPGFYLCFKGEKFHIKSNEFDENKKTLSVRQEKRIAPPLLAGIIK